MADARSLLCAGLFAVAAGASLHAMQQSKDGALNAALVFYRQNRLEEALTLFEQAATEDSTSPTTIAWFAETLRRLERVNPAVVQARRALALAPCHAFAHIVIGTAYNPQYRMGLDDYDSVWVHLRRAVDCDPNDGNGWLNIWGESLRLGDRQIEEKSLRRLIDTKFLSRTTLSYNRWLLRDLPENTVVVSNGDLDTYPALALQLTEGRRRDVVVVNLPMLHLWWYVQLVHARYGLPFPADSAMLASRPMCGTGGGDTVCLGNLVLGEWRRLAAEGKLPRPLAVPWENMMPRGPGIFVRTGPLLLLKPTAESSVDTAGVRRSLRGIEGRDFADPIVTPTDRSAVRIASASEKGMQLHLAWIAVIYGEELIRAHRLEDARDILEWVRRFAQDGALDNEASRSLVDKYSHELDAAEREP
ncbi:MAG TPA: hypothetical protein VEZ88_02445 [Steroidobacteraceae bacterium]|nr:hypothetical protein [Steroidobacteraceae bacterium]